ncbi:MAG: tRNA lysidine(34) synthetase TilS [Lentisphaerales bacterium]|nr:tRNA lysidine(34) synthetase TilS [Lentisphaerales bacterium]
MNLNTDILGKNKSLYLGFSGGADSTALAFSLIQKNIHFQAVHFHHHLREYFADRDAIFCKNFCKEKKIPFQQVDLYVKKDQRPDESMEAAARRLRQEWWQQNIDKGNSIVLLAHHRDDQRENFILRSMRGSSSTGLTGFRNVKEIAGVTYARPLFDTTREQIINFLNQEKINWCEDESNLDLNIGRNRTRHEILPSMSNLGSLEGLDRTILNTSKDADFLEESALDWLKQNTFTAANFLKCHDALKARVIRCFFYEHKNIDYFPGHDAVDRLIIECQKKHTESIELQLASKHSLHIDCKGAIFHKPQEFNRVWNWQQQNIFEINGFKFTAKVQEYSPELYGECFKVADMPDELILRNFAAGDRLTPFGRNSEVKVKKLLNDRKLSAEEKLLVPLICSDPQTIIWIPTVKRAQFAVAQPSEEVLVISYERL